MGLKKAKLLAEVKPCYPLRELQSNRTYRVTKVKKCETKHGDALTLSLDDDCYIYMPSRFVQHFYDDDKEFKELVRAVEKKKLTFKCNGKDNRNVVLNDDDDVGEESE